MKTTYTRTCNRCKQTLPANVETFVKDSSRPLGIAYECRACHRERKVGRENRTDRWSNLSPEQKKKVRARQLRYGRSPKGRAISLRNAYIKIDACDLTPEEVLSYIEQPCVYCGTTHHNRGLDRIDNSKPHVRGNVQTACTACNIARGDRFTVDEMMLIGKVISEIWKRRGHG